MCEYGTGAFGTGDQFTCHWIGASQDRNCEEVSGSRSLLFSLIRITRQLRVNGAARGVNIILVLWAPWTGGGWRPGSSRWRGDPQSGQRVPRHQGRIPLPRPLPVSRHIPADGVGECGCEHRLRLFAEVGPALVLAACDVGGATDIHRSARQPSSGSTESRPHVRCV